MIEDNKTWINHVDQRMISAASRRYRYPFTTRYRSTCAATARR